MTDDSKDRQHLVDEATATLNERHPNLMEYQLPEAGQAAIFRASVQNHSVLEYSQGLAHIENKSREKNAQTAPSSPEMV